MGGARGGLRMLREKDGATCRALLGLRQGVGRSSPPYMGGRELRLPQDALGAGSGLEGSCPISQAGCPQAMGIA